MSNEDRRFNRTERLFATILLLQNKPNMSSRDLAEHFGVSRRTIFRDLRALSESGVPLTYAEGGGYEILDGYQLPPLMLSAHEAATLLTGTAFMKLQPDASLRKDADQVAMKIRSVLPPEIRDYIDRLQASTVLDPYWLHAVQSSGEEEGRWYKVSEAVARQQSVIMEYYVASRDEVTRRRVDPLGLVYYTDHWNIIGYDHLRDDIRNFRLDRIQQLHVLSARFERPEGFSLASHLEARGMAPSNKRIRIYFTHSAYRRAGRAIPAKIEEKRSDDEGVEVTFYFENLEYVANWLLQYGTQAKVQEPAALQEKVRQEAVAMVGLYG